MEQSIVLGGGCFWCLDAVYRRLKGVAEVVSGYAGGQVASPSYEQVSGGATGHAEVVKVSFESERISLAEVLTLFFAMHDPTTLNRQGADSGTQYRSIILYEGAEQRETAQRVMESLVDQGLWEDPLVTQLEPLERFYPAEDYHQDYFGRHGSNGYCQAVIAPKLAKIRASFADRMQEPNHA